MPRLARATRHDDRADVLGLEDAEGGVLEELLALDEFDPEAQVGLVATVTTHRLGVGHPRDRRLDLVADEPPQRCQHFLGEQDDVVLGDERHLDVELSELGLPVGAEILVAVATGDLVVALDAADHEQLLEQLRALRQCVEAAGLQARGHQEVAGTLGRGTRQRRGLDLDELVLREHAARGGIDLGAQRIALPGPSRRRSR